MAKNIDKVQKQKDIAQACKELLLKKGISSLTMSEIAKSANMGKSTVYDYFKNKDEIVFYIMDNFMTEHDLLQKEKIQKLTSTREKIKTFFNFFYEDRYMEYREIYKDYISILLSNPNDKRVEFQTNVIEIYHIWLKDLIEEAIQKGELKPIASKLVTGLFVVGDGLFITSATTSLMDDLKKEFNGHIDALFDLIEIKKGKEL